MDGPPTYFRRSLGGGLSFALVRDTLHVTAFQRPETFVISVPLQEENHASDIVVNIASRGALGHRLQLLDADPVLPCRSLQNALWEGQKTGRGARGRNREERGAACVGRFTKGAASIPVHFSFATRSRRVACLLHFERKSERKEGITQPRTTVAFVQQSPEKSGGPP